MNKPVLQIQAELIAMPEWKNLARVQQFTTSIRVLERNGEHLEAFVRCLIEDPRSMQLTDVHKRAALDAAFEEVICLLHNYVAAALSLVDHTRIVYRELYESKGLFSDYQGEVKERFIDVPLLQFVQGLRHFAQHYRTPDVSYLLNFEAGKGTTRRLVLQKADLLEFSGWKAVARTYLDAAPDQIDIIDLVTGYSTAIRSFYKWMAERQSEIHAADQAAVAAKQAEAHRAMAPEVPGLIASMLDVVGLRNAFAFGLSPLEHARLAEYERDLPQWLNEGLKIIEGRFGKLPDDLVQRLRSVAGAGAL